MPLISFKAFFLLVKCDLICGVLFPCSSLCPSQRYSLIPTKLLLCEYFMNKLVFWPPLGQQTGNVLCHHGIWDSTTQPYWSSTLHAPKWIKRHKLQHTGVPSPSELSHQAFGIQSTIQVMGCTSGVGAHYAMILRQVFSSRHKNVSLWTKWKDAQLWMLWRRAGAWIKVLGESLNLPPFPG